MCTDLAPSYRFLFGDRALEVEQNRFRRLQAIAETRHAPHEARESRRANCSERGR